MRLNWKSFRLACCGVLLLLAAGCSGINTSYSVSPATFFMPGLVSNSPRQPAIVGVPSTPLSPEDSTQAN